MSLKTKTPAKIRVRCNMFIAVLKPIKNILIIRASIADTHIYYFG
ncbi:hypothetical protein M2372_001499 [Chryseobacterium sp. BIGb0232]|nr:hypothetical protein [Chryseobacterium sp. BIGb0232]ROS18007.1 hypothetical protein EDF65_2394 [Chryseobacterium nakagawai]